MASTKYIVRNLSDKKHRTRASMVLGLYAERLSHHQATIEAGNPENWFVIYEHNEKRSGLVVYRHPDECVIIQYAAVENEGKGQLRALVSAARRFFAEPVNGVCLDMDNPAVWKHLGFTHSGMVDFIPHLFSAPFEEVFFKRVGEIGQGFDASNFFELMQRRAATKQARIVIKPIY